MARILKYQEIEDFLWQELSSGRFGPGDRFYSENEMAARFSVTAVTARKAFAPLEKPGYLQRRRGSGTFVAQLPEQPRRLRLFRRQLIGIAIADGTVDNRLKQGRILFELHREIEHAGYLALLTGDDPAPLLEAGVEAVITFDPLPDSSKQAFKAAGVPVAGVHPEPSTYPTLCPDFEQGAQLVAQLAKERNIRQVLITGHGSDAELVGNRFHAPLNRALSAAAIAGELVLSADPGELDTALDRHPRLIVALNAWSLDPLRQRLRQRKLRPGDTVSLLVHGSNALAIPSQPSYSIFDYDPAEAARLLVDSLRRSLRGESGEMPPPAYHFTDRGSMKPVTGEF